VLDLAQVTSFRHLASNTAGKPRVLRKHSPAVVSHHLLDINSLSRPMLRSTRHELLPEAVEPTRMQAETMTRHLLPSLCFWHCVRCSRLKGGINRNVSPFQSTVLGMVTPNAWLHTARANPERYRVGVLSGCYPGVVSCKCPPGTECCSSAESGLCGPLLCAVARQGFWVAGVARGGHSFP
jgi:hypothetical protein